MWRARGVHVPACHAAAPQFVVGRAFYEGAAAGWRGGALGMDFMVAAGTTAAYLGSIANVFLVCSACVALALRAHGR